MLENLYTTKMSSNKKVLQKRFTKIRTKSSRLAKLMSCVCAFTLVFALTAATVVMAALYNDDTEPYHLIELTNNGEKIELQNEPFIENGSVYVPLREILEKIGIMDNANNQIIWDNGKIDIHIQSNIKNENAEYIIINHQIEIGKDTFKLTALNALTNGEFHLDGIPILKQSVTYVPMAFVDNMANGFVQDINTPLLSTFKLDYQMHVSEYFYHQFMGENFAVALPDSWEDKYTVKTSVYDDVVTYTFLHKATYEKYGEGTGCLFYIEKNRIGVDDMTPQKLLAEKDGYYYVIGYPTDVQYPIWIDRNDEDVKIAGEYEVMMKYSNFIENNIRFD